MHCSTSNENFLTLLLVSDKEIIDYVDLSSIRDFLITKSLELKDYYITDTIKNYNIIKNRDLFIKFFQSIKNGLTTNKELIDKSLKYLYTEDKNIYCSFCPF